MSELIGLVGKKCGMTRIYKETGEAIPVTVVEVQPNKITQVKTLEKDGYLAIQVTMGTKKKVSRVSKPLLGHYAKAQIPPGEGLWEFCLDSAKALEGENALKVGGELKIEMFVDGQYVDVWGITKGKGFAGVIKKHHCKGQNASHGCSLAHRSVGSIGQRQSPNWVAKGKSMPGHLGCKRRTVQNLQIVKVDKERQLLLIQGAVPGAPGGKVIVLPASKKSAKGG